MVDVCILIMMCLFTVLHPLTWTFVRLPLHSLRQLGLSSAVVGSVSFAWCISVYYPASMSSAGFVFSCPPGSLAGCFFKDGVVLGDLAKPGEIASFYR